MGTQRLLLVAALGGLVLAGLALAVPAPRLLRTSTPVSGLAMDGSTVAVATAWGRGHCERVVAWSPLRPSLKALGRAARCEETSTGRGILYQAVAGKRVAWVTDGGGNAHDSQLFVTSLDRPQVTRRLAFTTYNIDSGDGTYVGHVHGSGSLLVYATWTVCDTGEVGVKRCPGAPVPGTIVNAKLWRIEGATGKKLIASADDELAPIAVGAGRILVARADGSLEVRAADGHVLQTFTFDQPPLQAALGPKQLVVAVRDTSTLPLPKAKLEFRVYDLATGALVRTLTPPADAQTATAPRCSFPTGSSPAACLTPAARMRFQDVDATRLAFVLGSTVHLMRLAGGADKSYRGDRGTVLAQLAAPGLVYAYGTGGRTQGRVQFIPAAKLRSP
ncbi:MAG: hypothetical protein ACXWYS_02250 [Gaiellaceae bacterium]